ncbi:MAG: hypothetical protein AB8F26_05770, partial [Phycisphaerales bacterium]
MNTRFAAFAVLLSAAPSYAGDLYTPVSAGYNLSASAADGYSDTLVNTDLGDQNLSLTQVDFGAYSVSTIARSSFSSNFIGQEALTTSITRPNSNFSTNASSSQSITFDLHADTLATLQSLQNGWRATVSESALATCVSTLRDDAGAILLIREAPASSEQFSESINLPAGRYTWSVVSNTVSEPSPPAPGAMQNSGQVTAPLQLTFTEGFGPCSVADTAEPFGALNFFDVATFIGLYNAGDP